MKNKPIKQISHDKERLTVILSKFPMIHVDEWSNLDLFTFRPSPSYLDVTMRQSSFGGSPYQAGMSRVRKEAKLNGWDPVRCKEERAKVFAEVRQWREKVGAEFKSQAPAIRAALRKAGFPCEKGYKSSVQNCFPALRVGSYL